MNYVTLSAYKHAPRKGLPIRYFYWYFAGLIFTWVFQYFGFFGLQRRRIDAEAGTRGCGGVAGAVPRLGRTLASSESAQKQ
jgi:hypothetical protein